MSCVLNDTLRGEKSSKIALWVQIYPRDFLADYITFMFTFGIKNYIQFFLNENVYIRILCHSQNIFSLSSFNFCAVFELFLRFSLLLQYLSRTTLIFSKYYS